MDKKILPIWGDSYMNNTLAKRLFIGLATFFFIISTNLIIGCTGTKLKVKYEKEDNSGYSKAEHKHKHKKGGPPAHASAHGYRAKHKYHYYPSQKVYHDSDRGLYFYLKGDNWEIGASLPSHLKTGLGESVTIEMETDKPYAQNADHVKKYPPGKLKKKHKKKDKWS
jgi:hypothetical protein